MMFMSNHYKITFGDLRDVIEAHCRALISKGQMYENSQVDTCKISVDLRLPRILKGAVEIERSEDEILVTFTIIPSQCIVAKEDKSEFRFTKDRVYRVNYAFGIERELWLNNPFYGIFHEESIVLLALYQHLANEPDTYTEIDEEECEKNHDKKPKMVSMNTITIAEGKLVSHIIPEDKLREIHRLFMRIIYNYTIAPPTHSFNDFMREPDVNDLLNAMIDANTTDLNSN